MCIRDSCYRYIDKRMCLIFCVWLIDGLCVALFYVQDSYALATEPISHLPIVISYLLSEIVACQYISVHLAWICSCWCIPYDVMLHLIHLILYYDCYYDYYYYYWYCCYCIWWVTNYQSLLAYFDSHFFITILV